MVEVKLLPIPFIHMRDARKSHVVLCEGEVRTSHRQAPSDICILDAGNKLLQRSLGRSHLLRLRVVVIPAQQVLWHHVLFVETDGEDPVTVVLTPHAGRHLVDVRLRLQIHIAVLPVNEDTEVVILLTVPDRRRTTQARPLGRMVGLFQHLTCHPSGHSLVEGMQQFHHVRCLSAVLHRDGRLKPLGIHIRIVQRLRFHTTGTQGQHTDQTNENLFHIVIT